MPPHPCLRLARWLEENSCTGIGWIPRWVCRRNRGGRLGVGTPARYEPRAFGPGNGLWRGRRNSAKSSNRTEKRGWSDLHVWRGGPESIRLRGKHCDARAEGARFLGKLSSSVHERNRARNPGGQPLSGLSQAIALRCIENLCVPPIWSKQNSIMNARRLRLGISLLLALGAAAASKGSTRSPHTAQGFFR